QTTSVDPPRPTAGCYRRGPPAAPGWPGQSRPAGASQAQSRREDSVTPNWLNQTKLTSGFQGNPQLRFRFMAIATRRLQAPAAPPLCPGDRSAGGLRRPGPAGAPPRPDSRDAHRRVVEAALETGDVAATVEAVADLTGAAAVLQDRFLAVLASAPPPDGEADPTGIALSRAGGPLVRELLRDGSGRPALVELPRHGCTPARLVAGVRAGGSCSDSWSPAPSTAPPTPRWKPPPRWWPCSSRPRSGSAASSGATSGSCSSTCWPAGRPTASSSRAGASATTSSSPTGRWSWPATPPTASRRWYATCCGPGARPAAPPRSSASTATPSWSSCPPSTPTARPASPGGPSGRRPAGA